MHKLTIHTKEEKEVVDITDEIKALVKKNKFKEGTITLFLTHTTAALTTMDLDPGTDLDMLEAVWGMIPKLQFRHSHDPAHTPSHIVSAIIGTSLTLLVEREELILGTWQRVVLIEFDGPKERNISIHLK